MARDPFSPVPQSSTPPWVWIVIAVFGSLVVIGGATVAIVVAKRPAPVVAAKPPAVTPDTPAAGNTGTTTPTVAANDTKPAASDTDSKPDKTDKPPEMIVESDEPGGKPDGVIAITTHAPGRVPPQ